MFVDGCQGEMVLTGAIAAEQASPAILDELSGIAREAVAIVPARIAVAHQFVPLRMTDRRLWVASVDELAAELLDDLRVLTGRWITRVPASSDAVAKALRETYGVIGETVEEMLRGTSGLASESEADSQDDDESAQNASVIKLVNELLNEAVRQGASDLHLEPDAQELIVRLRINGGLVRQSVPAELTQFRCAIASRIKIVARLNIAEKRLPQDGGFRNVVDGREIDWRVSIIPMLHGEGIVLRLLDSDREIRGLSELAFVPELLRDFRRVIHRPHGIVLVTGPTGSGKTTTLYSALSELIRPDFKIITIEDPIEYRLPGINQIQVHPKIGLTFAAGLRSILRHDPDVILLGEVRDPETAQSAIQAALTGHLVLSTLHTNDACSAVTRLVEMGIEPYLVASTVEGILAQRLVRRLCLECRQSIDSSDGDELESAPDETQILWEPRGCGACQQTGYAGRQAIAELVVMDDALRALCIARADAGQLRRAARVQGLPSLQQSGWEMVMSGLTSREELLRAVADIET